MLDIRAIQEIIPHRFPFLLVDRILECEAGKRAVGLKNVTMNEPFFQGHYPGRPIMPGVLIIEALAQVGAVALLTLPQNQGKVPLFAGVKELRFRQQVVPGDQLRLEVELVRLRGQMGVGRGRATVEGKVAAEGEFLFFLAESE